jgi:lipoprotein-anchoring transpeptidase ErfK/SrfK
VRICFVPRWNRLASVAFDVVEGINSMHVALGQIMTHTSDCNRGLSQRVTNALVFAGILIMAPATFSTAASAQMLGYASAPQSGFPSDNIMLVPREQALTEEGVENSPVIPERLRRAVVSLETREAPGTVIIDTGSTALYYVLGQGRAIRYGVGVGREGFTWSGVQTISRKAEWPDWHPPSQMIARQPYLPRFMAGGPGNPLGARAMYLGSSEYRIHGTNDPSTIGKFVSSGCIRLTNEDVTDLFSRVDVGTKVVVLPKNASHLQARAIDAGRTGAQAAGTIRPAGTRSPAAMITAYSGRQAMNLSSSLY